jgi:drug/metabolite transporter (DMT)-like permease
MANPLSLLGIIHTGLSVVPLIAGLVAFQRHGRIDPDTTAGKLYWLGMIASVLTSFGLSSTGHFNAGHALGILALVVMGMGTVATRIRFLGRAAIYLQTVAMSFSFLLLMVPGTNETLSRLPPSHPIGNGPASPAVQAALGCVLVVFLLGTAYQLFRLRRERKVSF